MKLRNSIFLAVLSLFAFISCNSSEAADQEALKIFIVTPFSHSSLELAAFGFRQGLNDAGYKAPEVEFITLNAGGDYGAVPALVESALAQSPALLYVLTTTAAADAIELTDPAGVPLVYAAVTDPVAAGIVTSMDGSTTLATGVSDRYPVEEQVSAFLGVYPAMQSAGLVFNPDEANSRILADRTIAALAGAGASSKEYHVSEASEISAAVEAALAENDAVIVNGDNLVIQHLSEVVALCDGADKPLFVGDPDSVRQGAVAAVGPDYYEMGKRAGEMAALVLGGRDVRTIPSEYPTSFEYVVNTRAAKAMGVQIPASFWSSREIWESRTAAGE